MSVAALVAAALLAAAMGVAIQRGATCSVAAVDELLSKGRAHRFAAIFEASLWVLAGVLIASLWQLAPVMPAGYPVTAAMVTGAAIMGVGASINRACVFGLLARLGNGELVYLLSPIGIIAGAMLGAWWLDYRYPQALAGAAPVLELSQSWPQVAWIALALVLVRLAVTLFAAWRQREQENGVTDVLWSPHQATVSIGISFFFLLLLAGPWAYTDLLNELAFGLRADYPTRFVLLVALFAGAMAGGYQAGRLKLEMPTIESAARCLVGGTLLGIGGATVPGTNDGLMLLGVPMLFPFALVALVTMVLTVALLRSALPKLN